MMRRVHLATIAVLIALGSAPLHGASSASVTGVVRDSAGVSQIGAQVQLLRPDLSVILSVYTDAGGRFTFPSIQPGRYAVKAMGAWYLPSLRENIRVRSATVVNLTLNTLYEVMQWLPAEPRAGNAQKDDWAWTLRSAANRPLLRWLEDGPLVVVADESGAHRQLKARIVASGEQNAFGESGERIAAEVEDTPSNSRELLAHVDFAPGTAGEMEAMLGFRQDLGFAGSVQSVAAFSLQPEMEAAGAEGVDEAALHSWETIHLGDAIEAEVGADEVLARLSTSTPDIAANLLPFASAGWRHGNNALRYRMTTFLPAAPDARETEARSWLPALSARNGALAIEHGLHQELRWERHTDTSDVAVLIFDDRIDNPAIEAMSHFTAGDSAAATLLLDSTSGLIHADGPQFSAAGISAYLEHNLPGRSLIRLSGADGDALALTLPSAAPVTRTQLLAAVHPLRAQTYALTLSGTLDGSGTRWRASYRWQPEDTITQVAPFATNAAEPYLNLHLRQPIHPRGLGSNSFEAVLDVRNLLAQGYRPYLLSDGSLLVFAQDQRGFSAGLAFDF